MGKIRIKQIGSGFEEIKKPKRKKKEKSASTSGLSIGGSPDAEEKKRKTKTLGVSRSGSPDVEKRARRSRQQYGRSARYKKAIQSVASHAVGSDALELQKAIHLAQQTATAKFPESIEVHINTIKTGFRTTVSLPYSTGKKRSILIFTSNPKILKSVAFKFFESEALSIESAGTEKIAAIKKSGSPPDVNEIWATPDIMKDLAKIARILGPSGLMPNPKRGTVVGKKTSDVDEYTDEITAKLKELTSGRAVLETERKAPVIHTVIGKASMDEKKLTANMKAILAALGPKNIKKVTLASTMGPAIRLAL